MKKRKPQATPELPVNEWGSIDITKGIPEGLVHVDRPRLGPTCKRLSIECAKAISGWTDYGPISSGIVISEKDLPTLQAALKQKERENANGFRHLSVASALFTLNRRAKRCRDLAQTYYQYGMHGFAGKMRREKEGIYALKGQALHYLLEDGLLVGGEYHRYDGGNWTQVLRGGGFIFHRPCPPQIGIVVIDSKSIESKPKGSKEPTLAVARNVIAKYLADKPAVVTYQWPPKARSVRRYWNDDDFFDEFDEDFDQG